MAGDTSPLVSKPGPDYPFTCSVICPWNQPLSHLLVADAQDKVPISLWHLWPRLPGSAVTLLHQPLDWPDKEGQSTAGAQAVMWPRSLGTSVGEQLVCYELLSVGILRHDMAPGTLGILWGFSHLYVLCPVAHRSCELCDLCQTSRNCIQICSDTVEG